jgi:hypothetical protein
MRAVKLYITEFDGVEKLWDTYTGIDRDDIATEAAIDALENRPVVALRFEEVQA